MQTTAIPATRTTEWRRAWTALRALIADPERTELVFEIVDALSGKSFERAFLRFQAHPEGRRLLTQRPSLLDTLSNRAALRALPAGSFGRSYLAFMEAAQLSPEGLVEAEAMAARSDAPPVDADRQFFGDRIRDMHDLWHVLTGYGRDEAGEAANLAFTLAQVPSPGIALIVLAGAALGLKDVTLAWPRYLYRAWRRGRRAARLPVIGYEELLALPLEDVRHMLRIEPALTTHPGGILVASRNDVDTASAVASS